MSDTHEFFGREVIADLKDCENANYLNDVKFMGKLAVESAKISDATVVETHVLKFEPQGIDCCVFLSESSIFIHTYPEHKSCFINIFTCGRKAQPRKGINYVIATLRPKKILVHEIQRGIDNNSFRITKW